MGAPTPAKRARAPRKATATKVSGPKVVLDLDNLSKQTAFPDVDLPTKPFTFLLDGVQYELRDPRDSDWKLALELSGNPFLLMRTALVDADEPVDDPTDLELRMCRDRHGLPQVAPPEGSEQATEEAELFPTGVAVALIDRFGAAHLPTWKLNALFTRWHEHYRIDLSSSKGILAALLGRAE